MKKESVTLLQDLIRNKCVNYDTIESGQEIKSVNTLTKYLDSYNLSEYEVLESENGRANLLLKISGTENLLFLSKNIRDGHPLVLQLYLQLMRQFHPIFAFHNSLPFHR